jgi:hypothetical protein
MASTEHPITTPLELGRGGLDQPQPNQFLHPDSWPATHRSSGDALVAGWPQGQAEHRAARTSRPVRVEVAA